MRVVVTLQNNEGRTYENASRVVDKDKHQVYIYGGEDENNVLAILNKGDIRNLLTEDDASSE